MSALTQKTNELRQSLQPERSTPPQDTGVRLATFPRPEGELRFTWNTFEGHPFLRLQFWSRNEDGSCWPLKGEGLTIKVRDLPDLAEGLQKALDLAITETRKNPPREKTFEGTDKL